MTGAGGSIGPVVILTALDWEQAAVEKALAWPRGVPGGAGLLPDGTPAIVARMGIGLGRALAAARHYEQARAFVVVGCAGALQPQLSTGDLVVASAVGLADDKGEPQSHWPAADAGVAATAQRHGLPVHVGSILSSPIVLHDPAQKAALAATGALTVDMESAAVIGVALQRGIPFTALRVVLDTATEALPADMDAVSDDGAIRFGRAVRAALLHPKTMLRLASQRTTCEHRLLSALPLLLRGDALGLPPVDRTAPNA